jgi:hypothetical protein
MLLIGTERRHAGARRAGERLILVWIASQALGLHRRASNIMPAPPEGGAPMRSGREMGARIYLHCPGNDETVAIACGFNWGACLLGFIWALSKKMWFAAFVMLGVNLILLGMGLWGETADVIGLVLSILFAVACGVYGNRWHRWTLEKRGYVVV